MFIRNRATHKHPKHIFDIRYIPATDILVKGLCRRKHIIIPASNIMIKFIKKHDVFIVVSTNGTNLQEISPLVDSIALSRHHHILYQDVFNCKLIQKWSIPNKIHMTCNLIKGYIEMNYYGEVLNLKNLNNDLIYKYIIQLFNGIYFLHKNNISHGDIKPLNILMDNINHIIKIIDYGSVIFNHYEKLNNIKFNYRCTLYYISPEELKNNKYYISNDIWSLGCLLYELFTGKIFIESLLLISLHLIKSLIQHPITILSIASLFFLIISKKIKFIDINYISIFFISNVILIYGIFFHSQFSLQSLLGPVMSRLILQTSGFYLLGFVYFFNTNIKYER